MAQHSEYKRFLKLNKGFSNRGIEPTTEHSGENSNKRVHDLNTTSHARKRPKTKVEVNKTKDTTYRRVNEDGGPQITRSQFLWVLFPIFFSFVILTSL